MSGDPPAPNTNGSVTDSAVASPTPELDVTKLQSLPAEQQDLYLLTFVTTLSKHVQRLNADECTAQQTAIKKELTSILNLPVPAPTRVIRNSLGRCFAHVLGKGDRRLLFETVNELITTIAAGKNKTEAELRTKHAATHCLGEIFAAAGDSAIGLHSLACTTLVKLLKPAQNNAGLRAAIFRALGSMYGMIAGSADETTAKDVWKQARNHASGDKSYIVQIAACRCMESMTANCTPYFSYSSEYENLKSTAFKTIDSPSPLVRQAAASLLSTALVYSHISESVQDSDPGIKPIKRSNTKQFGGAGEDDGAPARSESPAPRKAQPIQFTLANLLKQISSQYTRSSTSNRVRAGLALCYVRIMKGLPSKVVETNYARIADHLFYDILSSPNIITNRYRLLITRRFVQVILQDVIGQQILGESGQIDAAKKLINDVLKNFPQVIPEKPVPTKYGLIAALGALTSFIEALGSASGVFADACREGLLQVVQHPSYTVQLYTAQCLRAFTIAVPQQMLPCLTICMNTLNREMIQLTSNTGRHSPRRCVGWANALSALMSTSPLQPLYGSVDVNSRVLSLATNLLKSSGKSELRISGTQIQVAWILIGGLMSLGPNFVKIHLSQLLLLWKNALPTPLSRDNTAQRSFLELSFLTHVRECALGSILSFLQFNGRLLTTDVSIRIATMLQNTSAFLKGLPNKKTTDDVSQRLFPALQLHDLDMMTQRRVLQCYTKLVNLSPGGSESLLQSNLLTLAVSFFSDPDNYTPSSLSTSIASSAGTFETIWDIGDNCGFGVNGLIRGFKVQQLPGEHDKEMQHEWTNEEGPDAEIDSVLLSPICSSLEHDSLALYVESVGDAKNLPDPPATEVVNVAIKLFAIAFPLTPPKIQESILEQITTFLAASSLQRDPGRKAAMNVNVSTALLSTLKVAAKETIAQHGDVSNPAVEKLLAEMLRGFVAQSDQYIRSLGYEALGRLCSASGNAYTNQEIKWLIDTIVAIREPSVRAGCAMALGCIHSQVGGMAAGLHLKTIVGILMSLCNDPNPTVHFWSLEALSRVADSAGLTFSGYVQSTLGMLGQLYTSDSHNDEQASITNSNIELELPTSAVVARCTDSLINVLGPDLQDMTKARELILTLVFQFRQESSILILAESLRCFEHLSLYAPGHLNFRDYVVLLQKDLQSSTTGLRDIAIDGLYNLMKRNSEDVIKTADPGFEDEMWLALDKAPTHDGIRNIIRNWLQQSAISDTTKWMERCRSVLAMTKAIENVPEAPTKKAGAVDLQDEEVAGFAAAAGEASHDAPAVPGQGQEPLRWQVRTFAMTCMGELFSIVARDAASRNSTSSQMALQKRVADIIRMAFSASTSNIVELRVWGLKIIDMVLKMFGNTPDPDFPEAPLLEQYQAQISSALTPAFAADSSPELASEAVNVCAAFIATGIVTDIDRMGRILKTLVTALENFSANSETASIGDLKGLSANAQVMVKMAVFSAWAELQVASTEQPYLVDVVKPYIAKLTPLWLDALGEFARLRFEPDISMSLGPASLNGSLDSIYAALNRETLLKFYQDSWLNLVDAIASLIEQDSEFVFDALDGKNVDPESANGKSITKSSPTNNINYRDEPVAFFFVLFGITFEALVAKPGSDVLAKKEQTLEILIALKRILHPSVSGQAIYRDAIFSETMELLDRLVLTDGLNVQAVIVQIARALCVSHPSARKPNSLQEGDLSDDIEQLFELTRIIVLVLAGLIPNLTAERQSSRSSSNLDEEATALIRTSLNALVDAAEVFPSIIKTDLHACIIHIFATILGTPFCQSVVVPQSLPIMKRFLSSISPKGEKPDRNTQQQLRGCLKRFMGVYQQAQKRELESSLPCVRNSLLACTVLLTATTNTLTASDPLMRKFLDEVVDCLGDRMTAKVAANCIRTLVLHSPKTLADHSFIRHLLPSLVNFVTTTDKEDPENARAMIAHTLTAFVGTLPADKRAPAMALMVPTLLVRAEREGRNGRVYQDTGARLLELAAADQSVFRATIGALSEAQRKVMEEVLRAGQGPKREARDEEEREEPTIKLSMNFG